MRNDDRSPKTPEYDALLEQARGLTPEKLDALEKSLEDQIANFRAWLEPTIKTRIVGALTLGGWILKDNPARVGRYVLDHLESKARVIISGEIHGGGRWIHLSYSFPDRLPTWDELKAVKARFLGDDCLAVQVFPPKTQWVNVHSFCLHLWCSLDGDPVPDFRKTIGDVVSI